MKKVISVLLLACMLLVATGLRICGIKMFAVVNMLPALVLAMPISAAWTLFFA